MTRPAAYRHASRVILHSASKGHDGTQNQASETRKVAEIRKSSATFPKPMFDTGRMAFSEKLIARMAGFTIPPAGTPGSNTKDDADISVTNNFYTDSRVRVTSGLGKLFGGNRKTSPEG
jgi:hypothetical protein